MLIQSSLMSVQSFQILTETGTPLRHAPWVTCLAKQLCEAYLNCKENVLIFKLSHEIWRQKKNVAFIFFVQCNFRLGSIWKVKYLMR